MRSTTQQRIMIFFLFFFFLLHVTVQNPPLSVSTYASCALSCIICSHRGRWRHTSDHMVLLLLYSPLRCTYRKKKNPKCVRFVCTLCYIGTELYRKKKRNSGVMTEKHAISNPFDLKWWCSVRKLTESRAQNKGLFQYLLHQNVVWSGVGISLFSWQDRCAQMKVSGSSAQSVRVALPFLFWWSLTLRSSVHNRSQRERKIVFPELLVIIIPH